MEPSQIKLFSEVPEMEVAEGGLGSQGHLPSPEDSLQASALGRGRGHRWGMKSTPLTKPDPETKDYWGQLPPPSSHGETTVPKGAGTC